MSIRFARRGAFSFSFLLAVLLVGAPTAAADDGDLLGDWYGVGRASTVPLEERLHVSIFPYADGSFASLDIPVLGVRGLLLPVTRSGDAVIIGVPGVFALVGTLDGCSIAGTTTLLLPLIPPTYDEVSFQLWKDTGQGMEPGDPPAEPCDDLPDLLCLGSYDHCSALVPFEPVEGPGYRNEPENGETWENQYRSFLRRDLRQLVQYATAKVACQTAHWDSWPFTPLGLVDMSEADGSIPGASIGYPGHPPGTHENGRDIDVAYYQLFAPDNRPRVIGDHFDAVGVEQYHLMVQPPALDVWRTALLIASLAEHPRLRVIGVDGQAGPLLEAALDELADRGWIDEDLRARIPLAYEVTDEGRGWFRFHHHHLHVSLVPLADVVAELDLDPDVLNTRSKGKTITAYLELVEGYDVQDVDRVALLLDGHTLLPALARPISVGDRDHDGVPDLMLKFDRGAVLEALPVGVVEVSLAGVVDGVHFRGTDTVRVR